MELVGILQNASAIGYVRTHNDLFTASFELPFDDPKNTLCDTYFIVDIFDGETSKGKYRILDEPETDITTVGQFSRYTCEHVVSFLLNDVIDGYLELGGTGVNTRTVIETVLSMQTVKRWKLGTCDFNYQFQYSWENTNLLDALFSIPTCFADDYHWTYDTDSYPWTINLVRQDTDRSCEIRRKRNMQYIKREKDVSSGFYTRLYCKGSGEGVNQLNIREVNGGLPYIDADTIGTYGVICGHYIDLTLTDAETLLAKGRAVLEEVKHPRYTYKAKAIDLSKVTGLDWHNFDEGKFVHIIDEEKKIDLDAMIIEVSKQDVDGDPLDVDLTISNKPSDASSAIEDLSKRAAITAQYSQGATNLYSQQYSDNADADHPATMRVFVPSECKQINKMLLSWRVSAFRAYETGAAAGGSTVITSGDGGATTITSGAGGATTITSGGGGGQTITSSSGGGQTYTSSSGGGETYSSAEGGGTEVTSSSGGGSERTSSAGGSTTITEEQEVISTVAATGGTIAGHSGDTSGNTGPSRTSGGVMQFTSESGSHYHGMQHHHPGPSHTHSVNAHSHTGGSHSHIFGHYHYAPSHSHSVSGHSHTGPSHRHSGPSHTHSFSDTYSMAWGHTHSISSGASATGGVRNYSAKSIRISGTTGSGGTGYTGYSGTGSTGSTSLTTNSGGNSLTGNAVYSSGNSHTVTASGGNVATSSVSLTTNSSGTGDTGYAYYAGAIKNNTNNAGEHSHDMYHYHNFSHSHNVVAVITIPSSTIRIPSHTHSVTIPGHTHEVTIPTHSHTVTIYDHMHEVTIYDHIHEVTLYDHTHEVTLYDHTHTVETPDHTHSITLGDHTHDIVYGIYTGSTARNVSIRVDGSSVPTSDVENNEIDIVAYLAKDNSGKITRGTWHEIELVPDGLTRIEANLFVQTFVTSYSGGNY